MKCGKADMKTISADMGGSRVKLAMVLPIMAVLFAKCSPVKCFPWCIGLSVLAVAGIFACPNPVAFFACVFVAALASANTFGICMGVALDRMPEKANEITALMVMAIAGGAVLPPILGFAQKQAGCTGLVWVLLACLAYQAVLAAFLWLTTQWPRGLRR